ncbi:CBL-interacting protein kinase 2 [Actinidia rufa]|uniref:non-specific serine/threonine protein kinase n=1 Tax=Actinidia rufa TaxID=165716 RepID=A0A7J0FU83_9ERIC|nr:CBL-interacting protein kinase 2 [Actinidia rufa]
MDNKGTVLMERYELGRLLGQGTFAKVYYARNVQAGQNTLILCRFLKSWPPKPRFILSWNMLKEVNFSTRWLKESSRRKLLEKYFQQLINAVDFCHSRGVYHRDLKPENLLLDENENLKVSDFGLSALAESKHQDGLLHTTCGTPAYVAPEVINRRGYDGEKADVWSCGVILFVLLAGYLPFHDSNLMEMYRKIGKAEYKCPNWFPAEVRKLLLRILDPNPNTRISIAKIKETSWFKKGLNSKLTKTKTENTENVFRNADVASGPCETSSTAAEKKQELPRAANLNAFDIISFSAGFDLSGLFEEPRLKKEARFTSRQPASVILSKLEEIAKHLKLRVRKKEAGLVKFEGLKEGRKGILSIDAEIFEVTPSFHLVEVKKSDGDTLEYQKVLNEGMRPALQDIVWAWQGEQQQPPLELHSEPLPQQLPQLSQQQLQQQLQELLPSS